MEFPKLHQLNISGFSKKLKYLPIYTCVEWGIETEYRSLNIIPNIALTMP